MSRAHHNAQNGLLPLILFLMLQRPQEQSLSQRKGRGKGRGPRRREGDAQRATVEDVFGQAGTSLVMAGREEAAQEMVTMSWSPEETGPVLGACPMACAPCTARQNGLNGQKCIPEM